MASRSPSTRSHPTPAGRSRRFAANCSATATSNLDSLVFPAMLGVSARVESPCHATGEPIRVDVAPDRIRHVEPSTAVISIVPRPQASSIRASFCHHIHFFASANAAQSWLTEHPDASIVPVAHAQQHGRDLIEALPAVGASCSDHCC